MAGIDPKFYYLTLGLLALCTIVGLIVAFKFQREVNEDLSPPTEKDLLGPLEKAFYSGLMREEEFLRIQESMAKQRGEVYVPSTKAIKARVSAAEPAPAGPEVLAATPDEIPTKELPAESAEPPPVTPTDESAPGPSPG